MVSMAGSGTGPRVRKCQSARSDRNTTLLLSVTRMVLSELAQVSSNRSSVIFTATTPRSSVWSITGAAKK
jgi:hypothetical protein